MATDNTERPTIVTDEIDQFMHELQDTGEVNMFGAGPDLEAEFDMSRSEAREVIMWWISQ